MSDVSNRPVDIHVDINDGGFRVDATVLGAGPAGPNGKDGGYYTPAVTQPEANKLQFEFAPSKSDMPVVEPVQVNLPAPESGGDVDLEGYATEQYVRDYAQPKGKYLTEVPDGYAKSEDIPRKTSELENNSGFLTDFTEADPTVPGWAKEPSKPSYTKAEVGLNNVENVRQYSASNPPPYPVTSVNGKTGSVSLDAAAVGARPATWMPTAQEVGALPNTYEPPNQTAAQVGADPKGTAASAVSQHNTADDAHGDIRLELKAINDRLTAFFDSDDQTLDEMSEIVAYITSNKSLIDSVTTSKVSVADIINNLTTNVSNKPLSAAQGVALKSLIDAVSNSLANYQPKGDYALRSEIPTVPTKVSAFENDKGYLTEHQDISGKLDATALPTAINTALAQAKASGEFDGSDGSNGKDGTSVTVKSVNESTADGGSNVVTFSDGKTLTVKNGGKGGTGATGATGPTGPKPVKGVDYFTEADQEAIVQQVITALGTPVFGRVDENNNIILTGELADGTYTLKYEDAEGKQTVIGTLENVKYVNQLTKAINADGTPYNGGQGWKTGYRLNSSGAEAALDGMEVTGFIPVKYGDVVYMSGVGWKPGQGDAQRTYLWCYDSNKNYIAYGLASGIESSQTPIKDSNGNLIQFTANGATFYTTKQGDIQNMAYFRLNCESITADSIITVNQPIE